MTDQTEADLATVPGELTLTAVGVALSFAIGRAFIGWSAFAQFTAVVIAAHLVALVQRRLRVPALVATLVSLTVGAMLLSNIHYRALSWYGLPTTETWHRAVDDAHRAFAPFRHLVAPVAPATGLLVAVGVALWLIATFADLAAFRADAPIQAVIPHLGGFAFSSVLVVGRYGALCAAAMICSLATFTLAVRAGRAERNDGPGTGPTAVAFALVSFSVVALVALSVVLAPLVRSPGLPNQLIDLRAIGRAASPSVVVSPLVSLDSQLGDQSDQVMFTARSTRPHYWRLTALDEFDGRSWSADANYHDISPGQQLTSPFGPDARPAEEGLDLTIAGLRSNWLPSAFAPLTVSSTDGLRFDQASSSIFVNDPASMQGSRYQLRVGVVDPADQSVLRGRPAGSGTTETRDLKLPSNFPIAVRQLARRLVAGNDAFGGATAIERYLRTFTYDRQVNYSGAVDPLSEFLSKRRGFCQQFATAFAAMARSVGIPSRVAVGFTYGDVDPGSGPIHTWTVRGRHAHAWPEVNLAGLGWVSFEPTPGRGNPDSVGFSQIAPAQAIADDAANGDAGAATPSSTVAQRSPTPAPGAASAPSAGPGATTTTTAASAATNSDAARRKNPGNTGGRFLLAALVLVAALVGSVALRLRMLRSRDDELLDEGIDPALRVARCWRRACRDLARLGAAAAPAETPAEFARRVTRETEFVGLAELAELAEVESDRRYRHDAISTDEASRAAELADLVRSETRSRLGRLDTVRARLDLTPKAVRRT